MYILSFYISLKLSSSTCKLNSTVNTNSIQVQLNLCATCTFLVFRSYSNLVEMHLCKLNSTMLTHTQFKSNSNMCHMYILNFYILLKLILSAFMRTEFNYVNTNSIKKIQANTFIQT